MPANGINMSEAFTQNPSDLIPLRPSGALTRNGTRALRRRGLLRSRWPWRSAAYLLTTAPLIAAVGPLFAVLALPWLYVLAHRGRDRPPFGTVALLVILGAVLAPFLGALRALGEALGSGGGR